MIKDHRNQVADLSDLSLDELSAYADELLHDMASIKMQLDHAKAVPKDERDREWMAKARHALRMKGIEHQRVLTHRSALKKEVNAIQNASFERAFIRVVKGAVDEGTFAQWVDRARKDADPSSMDSLAASR